MDKKLLYRQLAGFIFTGIAGTLLHFVYDWSGESAFTAFFSAVNESTWEHMKILFVPMFVFALIQRFLIKDNYPNFWCAKLAGIAAGLISIPIIFYTYKGILGKTVDWFNIAIFFIAAAIAYLTEAYFLKKEEFCKYSSFAFFILCLIALTFVIFTWATPEIPLFQDPLTKMYGI
ncbi:MAG: hypothetical protein E7480_02995 [Ruminococcaceae bacterium]|nr:hypothetical protein [Oscillospiraceae bacterium]